MNIIALAGFALTSVIIAVLLKQQRPEYAVMLTIGAGMLILIAVFSTVVPAITQINSFISRSGVPVEYGKILFKSLGICFITQFAADSCRDAGEAALAAKLELAGKVAVVTIALPLFTKIAELATKMISG